MFCICSSVKTSISLTQRWICNDLKSNGSGPFQGYCNFEMGLFEDSGSNFILLNSEMTEGFPQQSLSLRVASWCNVSLLHTKLEGLVCNTIILSVTTAYTLALAFPMNQVFSCALCQDSAWVPEWQTLKVSKADTGAEVLSLGFGGRPGLESPFRHIGALRP